MVGVGYVAVEIILFLLGPLFGRLLGNRRQMCLAESRENGMPRPVGVPEHLGPRGVDPVVVDHHRHLLSTRREVNLVALVATVYRLEHIGVVFRWGCFRRPRLPIGWGLATFVIRGRGSQDVAGRILSFGLPN